VKAFVDANPGHPLVADWQARPGDKPAFYRLLKLAIHQWAAASLPGPLPESWSAFRERIELSVLALQALAADCERILAISSGGAMAALLGGRLDLQVGHIVDLNMQIRNTSICRFFVNPRRFLLSSWNGVPHLEGDGREDAITYG
jgi:broad specificity phosphatase PhoE